MKLVILGLYLTCNNATAEFTTVTPSSEEEEFITEKITFNSDLDYNSDNAEELSLLDENGK